MDVQKEWEVGKTDAECDSKALDDGKSSSSDLQERESKRKERESKRKDRGELCENRSGLRIRCEGDNDVYDARMGQGDQGRGVREGLEGHHYDSDMSITPKDSMGNYGIKVSTSEDDGGQSSCDPLEYISEVWRKYDEHCAFVEANPECLVLKLTLEEFVGQTDADESEFGPGDTLETIWEEIIRAPLPFEERIRLWKQRHNRFVEVEWMKKKREEEAERNRQ